MVNIHPEWSKTVASFLILCCSSRLSKTHIVLGEPYPLGDSAKLKNVWELHVLHTDGTLHLSPAFTSTTFRSSQNPCEMSRILWWSPRYSEGRQDRLVKWGIPGPTYQGGAEIWTWLSWPTMVFPTIYLPPRCWPLCLISQLQVSYWKREIIDSTQWGAKIKGLKKGYLGTLQTLSSHILVVFHDCLMDVSSFIMHHPINIDDHFVAKDQREASASILHYEYLTCHPGSFHALSLPTHGNWWSVWCGFVPHNTLRWFLGHL